VGGVHISTTAEAFLNQASLYCASPLFKLNLDRERIKRIYGNGGLAIEALAKIEVEIAEALEWIRAALYYVGQRYNFLYFLAKPLKDDLRAKIVPPGYSLECREDAS
jgi:hypothetical protein